MVNVPESCADSTFIYPSLSAVLQGKSIRVENPWADFRCHGPVWFPLWDFNFLFSWQILSLLPLVSPLCDSLPDPCKLCCGFPPCQIVSCYCIASWSSIPNCLNMSVNQPGFVFRSFLSVLLLPHLERRHLPTHFSPDKVPSPYTLLFPGTATTCCWSSTSSMSTLNQQETVTKFSRWKIGF